MILKFTRTGKFLFQVGKRGQSKGSLDKENFNNAADIYVYPKTNEAFIADGYVNRRVVVLDADGAVLWQSLAIIDYLDARYDKDRRSFPADREYWDSVAVVTKWQGSTFVEAELHPITTLGKALVNFPVAPRYAKMYVTLYNMLFP